MDEKIFRVCLKNNNHLSTKINDDGTRKAIQFSDDVNGLGGPVDLQEVDISELVNSVTPKDINPYAKQIINTIFEQIVVPGLQIGAEKLQQLLLDKGIPTAKKAIKKLVVTKGMYIEILRDVMTGKETKASQLIKEAKLYHTNTDLITEYTKETNQQSSDKLSIEEVQQIFDALNKSVFIMATCIRILTNAIVMDDGSDPDTLEDTKKQLEELNTQVVKNQINLMLEEKNRCLLDESTYRVLLAFRSGNFIVEGNEVPIQNYLV